MTPRWAFQLANDLASRRLTATLDAHLDALLLWLSHPEHPHAVALDSALRQAGFDRQRAARRAYELLDRLLFATRGRPTPQTLRVSPNADPAQAKQRYRRLIQVYHPDRHPTRTAWATQRTERINLAFDAYRRGIQSAPRGAGTGSAKARPSGTSAAVRERWHAIRFRARQTLEMLRNVRATGQWVRFHLRFHLRDALEKVRHLRAHRPWMQRRRFQVRETVRQFWGRILTVGALCLLPLLAAVFQAHTPPPPVPTAVRQDRAHVMPDAFTPEVTPEPVSEPAPEPAPAAPAADAHPRDNEAGESAERQDTLPERSSEPEQDAGQTPPAMPEVARAAIAVAPSPPAVAQTAPATSDNIAYPPPVVRETPPAPPPEPVAAPPADLAETAPSASSQETFPPSVSAELTAPTRGRRASDRPLSIPSVAPPPQPASPVPPNPPTLASAAEVAAPASVPGVAFDCRTVPELLERFRDAYETGALNELMALYSPESRENDLVSWLSIRHAYAEWFRKTSARRIVFQRLEIEPIAGQARCAAVAIFQVSYLDAQGQLATQASAIEFLFERRMDALHILRVRY